MVVVSVMKIRDLFRFVSLFRSVRHEKEPAHGQRSKKKINHDEANQFCSCHFNVCLKTPVH